MIDLVQWWVAIGLYNIKGISSRVCSKESHTIQYCERSDKHDCDDDDITDCQVPGGIVYSDNDNTIDIPCGAWSIYDNTNRVALLLYCIIILLLSCVLCDILSYIWMGYYHNQDRHIARKFTWGVHLEEKWTSSIIQQQPKRTQLNYIVYA